MTEDTNEAETPESPGEGGGAPTAPEADDEASAGDESDDSITTTSSAVSDERVQTDGEETDSHEPANQGDSIGADERYCSSCGSVIKKEAEICPECGVRQQGSPGGTPEKNPGAAALLSFFITGAGQIYNGQVGKGLLFMLIQAVNVVLMLVLIGFLTYFVVWAFAIYDAYTVAERINEGDITV